MSETLNAALTTANRERGGNQIQMWRAKTRAEKRKRALAKQGPRSKSIRSTERKANPPKRSSVCKMHGSRRHANQCVRGAAKTAKHPFLSPFKGSEAPVGDAASGSGGGKAASGKAGGGKAGGRGSKGGKSGRGGKGGKGKGKKGGPP